MLIKFGESKHKALYSIYFIPPFNERKTVDEGEEDKEEEEEEVAH